MKELSIEEKAQRYDEAIKRARYWEKNPTVWSSDDICQKLFPELAVSEDERIRKEIIAHIKWCEDSGYCAKEEMTRWITFLEKQGEQNPNPCDECVNRKGCINCEDGNMKETLDKVESKFKVKYAGSEYNVLEVKDSAGVTFYGIEDEPNHIDYIPSNDCEIVSEQNSAWSEEDESWLNSIICDAEQEALLDAEQVNWLKSLKERYTWKPSDEQMETLKFACGGNYVNLGVLESLYAELKKLKK